MSTDEDKEIDDLLADIDIPAIHRRNGNESNEYSPAELEEELKSIDELGVEHPVSQDIKEGALAAKAYVLKRDRSRLIWDLERACALAETMDDPVVTSSLQKVLARLRGNEDTVSCLNSPCESSNQHADRISDTFEVAGLSPKRLFRREP